MNVYERLGKTIEERDAQAQSFAITLNLLRRLQDGTVQIEDVVITDVGWTVGETRPPADDNGSAVAPRIAALET